MVSTHSLDRVIWDRHIAKGTSSRRGAYLSYHVGWIAHGNWGGGISAIDLGDISNAATGTASRMVRRLALYGIHWAPFRYLNSSSGITNGSSGFVLEFGLYVFLCVQTVPFKMYLNHPILFPGFGA